RGDDNDVTGVRRVSREAHVAPVGAREKLGLRIAVQSGASAHQAKEGLVRVRLAEELPEIALRDRFLEEAVRGDERSPHQLHAGDREGEVEVVAKLLPDFALVPMPC